MKKLLPIFSFLLFCLPAHAVTWGHIVNCAPAAGGSGVSTYDSGSSCGSTSVPAGALTVVSNWWVGTATSVADSDSVSSTGWVCKGYQINGVGTQQTQVCYTCNVASTTTTYKVTMTPSGGTVTFPRMKIDVFTGPQATSGCLDISGQTTVVSGTTSVTTPSITTTKANDLVWAAAGTSAGASFSANSPWTLGGQDAGSASEYQGISGGVSIGSYSPNFTMGSSSNYNTDILAFAPAPAAGATFPAGGIATGP